MVGLGCGARSYTGTVHYSGRLRGPRLRGAGDHRRLRRAADRGASPSPTTASGSTPTSSGAATSCSRCCNAKGWRSTAIPPAFRDGRSGRSAAARRLEPLGLAPAQGDAPRPDRRGAGAVRRDRALALLPGACAPLMEDYEWRLNLSILYRGPLSSCNYGCGYCPFAKRARDGRRAGPRSRRRWSASSAGSTARPADDRIGDPVHALGRGADPPLVSGGAGPAEPLAARRAGRRSRPTCRAALDWVGAVRQAQAGALGDVPSRRRSPRPLPGKCRRAGSARRALSASASSACGALRRRSRRCAANCPQHVYLWINAYKARPDYYRPGEAEWLTAIDPLFPLNNRRHPSLGRPCRAGIR